MKTLFTESDRMNSVADAIDKEAYEAVLPIFKKYFEEGYSARNISYIISFTVRDIELNMLLFSKDPLREN